MELRMSEINSIYLSLIKLENQKFPIKTAYKLAKLIDAIETERAFFQKEFQDLLNEYAEKDETGAFKQDENKESVIIKKDCLVEFEQEYTDLLNLDITLPNIVFSLDEFEGCELTLAEVFSLQKFITE